jgi:hypothetical protein
MGLHKNIAEIHASMLEQAVYRIKTQLGISQGSYSHSAEWPSLALDKGSCASPPFWLLNCSAYLSIYQSCCYGATYSNMDGTLKTKVGMTSCVDNNNCNMNCQPAQEATLCAHAEHDAQLWNDILCGSRGALEHSKCTYKYLRTEFTATGTPYFQAGSFGTPITIPDDSGQTTPIEHSSAYHAYKTLGTFLAATKRQTIQYQMLKKKAMTPLRNLALSTCSANAAWLYYSSIFMKGIGYPLFVSRLSKTQLKQLQAPITALTLNRLGYPKSLSRTVVFGSCLHSRLEFASLDTTQGAGKIQLLLRHFRTPGQPHDIALVVVNCFQNNAGVGFHILEDTQRELPHLEGIRIPTIWACLATINGSLQIAKAKIQTLQRHGDQYIMDVVLASRLFKPWEIKFINYSWLYLQVLSLSDMYNAQGNALAVGIYNGYQSASQSCSVLLEPLQEQPSKVTWSLWRWFLRFTTADGCWVCEPLGPWYNGFFYASSLAKLFCTIS